MDAHRLVAPAWGLFFLTLILSPTPAGGAVHVGPTPAPHRWLLLDGTGGPHDVQVSINGESYATYDDGEGGSSARPTPLREGRNTIVVTFRPRQGALAAVGSAVRIQLSPRSEPGPAPLSGMRCETTATTCTYRIELEITGGVPGRLRYVRNDWLDAARTRLGYEERVDSHITSEMWDDLRARQWTAAGRSLFDIHVRNGRVQDGTFYKPDGTPGARVSGGRGVYREWTPAGRMTLERPYKNGLSNGVQKTYYRSGRVGTVVTYRNDLMDGECGWNFEDGSPHIRGAYRAGEKNGTWVRRDKSGTELARTVFDNGEIRQGNDSFDDFQPE